MDGWLNDRMGPERADDARLIVSELVSNAVRHGGVPQGRDIVLGVHASESSVKIVVEQPTRAHAHMVEPSAEREGGIGLTIVDRLADSWGVELGVPGKVWFAIVTPRSPA